MKRLFNGCPHCFDKSFSHKVKTCATGPADLLTDTCLARAVRTAFEKCRSTNILCETRFARIASQLWSSSKGRRSSLASMSSKNLLAEMKHQHFVSAVQWNELHGRPAYSSFDSPTSLPSPTKKSSSAWHLFFEERRAAGGITRNSSIRFAIADSRGAH